MRRPSRQYLDGLLTAQAEVAAITGEQPMKGMTDREWKLINKLHLRLCLLSAAEAKRLEEK